MCKHHGKVFLTVFLNNLFQTIKLISIMKTKNIFKYTLITAAVTTAVLFAGKDYFLNASSHREAPMISNDPLADNTDLYAFRSPDDTNTVTIIANYIPFELPQGGPNYYSFGENINYEIHIKNNSTTTGDDMTYRFTFTKVNEDPTTFFNIRLGKQNLKTSYKLEKSVGGGTFSTIVTAGVVPPPNIGPRSIDNATLGLNSTYEALMAAAITTASSGEKVFAGPVDDPFFVDLGGIFDVGQTRAGAGARDGLKKMNVHSLALKIPISMLQKDGKTVSQASNILDGNFVIGVWASASRPMITTFMPDGIVSVSGAYVQISRIGMPLTNEAVIPIGSKDKWNARTPYAEDTAMAKYFCNPELALYMDDSQFGGAVPAFQGLRIQKSSLGSFDFRNTKDGLYSLKSLPPASLAGTAFEVYKDVLLQNKRPRSVDLLPIFYTGVPNAIPYQLATGKADGHPLDAGKPFINNFLPTLGDMLRLNMAVPVTPRNHPKFSSLGLVQAAVLGLTDPAYNMTKNLQFIPNMDGFPNGRRLEDDVTRIELQAVGGVVLAAIGLWYDDYTVGVTASPVTTALGAVLGYTTGVEKNDTTFKSAFPFVQTPWRGYSQPGGPGAPPVAPPSTVTSIASLGNGLNLKAPMVMAYPNPFVETITIKFQVIADRSKVEVYVLDALGRTVSTVANEYMLAGTYEKTWNAGSAVPGMYYASVFEDGKFVQTLKLLKK
jgi:hypothetical protein